MMHVLSSQAALQLVMHKTCPQEVPQVLQHYSQDQIMVSEFTDHADLGLLNDV